MSNIINIKGNRFETLVAISEKEQQRGLMWCKWPPPIMTFLYSQASYNRFWMKNTISPLDIVFCNAGKVVGIFKGNPLSTELIGPNELSDMVVELPYGTSKSIDLKVGDAIHFIPGLEIIANQLKNV